MTDNTAAPTPARPTIASGVYEHYKGERYLVIGLAHDSNHDARTVVVYVPLYDAPGPRLAVRDEADFHALLHADGTPCSDVTCYAAWGSEPHRPRFRLITD